MFAIGAARKYWRFFGCGGVICATNKQRGICLSVEKIDFELLMFGFKFLGFFLIKSSCNHLHANIGIYPLSLPYAAPASSWRGFFFSIKKWLLLPNAKTRSQLSYA